MRRTKILICSSELGAGVLGASLGPDAVRISSVNMYYNLFERLNTEEIKAKKINRYSPENKSAKYIKVIASTHQKIARKMCSTLEQDHSVLIFSGDHSNAAGFIAGFREAHIDKKIGVIWIDAHGDLHSPYTSPSGNMHGMPVAILMGLDNIENQKKKKIKEDVIKSWEKIKATGKSKITPKILPEDLIFIGIRDLEKQEWDLIQTHKIKHYTPDHIRKPGLDKIIDETIAHFASYDAIYISFDVDSLDPTISSGTGTPVPDGLSLDQAKKLLRAFTSMPNCKVLEVTEINPLLDTQNKMANAVVKILREAVVFS
jgi:arginase